jgi:hypothetical protein
MNLVYTLRCGPSIWIIRTSSPRRCILSWIHSCIRYAVILGPVQSKLQTMVLRRWLEFMAYSSGLRAHFTCLEHSVITHYSLHCSAALWPSRCLRLTRTTARGRIMQSPDRSARSQSLYRLSYRAHAQHYKHFYFTWWLLHVSTIIIPSPRSS